MQRLLLGFLAAIPALLIAATVSAHDPSEHASGSEAPDCEAMHGIDTAKMEADDPMMQALMQKCMQEAHSDAGGHDEPGEKNDEEPHDAGHGEASTDEDEDEDKHKH